MKKKGVKMKEYYMLLGLNRKEIKIVDVKAKKK